MELADWFLFYQTVNDNIAYIDSHMVNPSFMARNKFLNSIFKSIFIKNSKEMQENLEKGKTILLFSGTGLWEVKEVEKREATFEELLKLNKKEENTTIFNSLEELKRLKESVVNFSRKNSLSIN